MPPYQILALRNVRNTGTAKLPVQTFATCKMITPKNSISSEKERKKLCKSRTTLRNNRKERNVDDKRKKNPKT